jgi:hypothetical protein
LRARAGRGRLGEATLPTSVRVFSVFRGFIYSFQVHFSQRGFTLADVTNDTFRKEIVAAVKVFDKHVVCLEKTPEEFEAALNSLVQKAIAAYENRGLNLRHGIALDKQVTVILSQSDGPRPLCGIYFNLHSPYQKNTLPKTVKAIGETLGDAGADD